MELKQFLESKFAEYSIEHSGTSYFTNRICVVFTPEEIDFLIGILKGYLREDESESSFCFLMRKSTFVKFFEYVLNEWRKWRVEITKEEKCQNKSMNLIKKRLK